MTDDRIAYTIPRVFFDDHIGRDLPPYDYEGVVKKDKSTYTILLTPDEVSELLSDADHYSSVVWWAEDGSYFGLQSSARATVKRIKAQRA